MYNNPTNESEANNLLEELKSHDGKLIPKENLPALREIFAVTPYVGLRDLIATTLVEAEDEPFYKFLISKIKEVIHTKYVSSLIYVSSKYNCAEDIQLFIDLIILKSDVCLADAMHVIANMEDIDTSEKLYAINKLKAYLLILDERNSKLNDVSDMIDYLIRKG